MAAKIKPAAVVASTVLCAYLRLTVDRNGKKVGYDVQRRAIQRWADAMGFTIGHWYQDKDLTAADRSVVRPAYEQMLTDVAAGQWGGIVVWKIDRLVRLTREFERCFGVVHDGGGFIVSLEPSFDTRDEIGRFVMRLLVMLAEMEIVSMKVRAAGHQKYRAEHGMLHGGGKRPYGFAGAVRNEDGKVLNSGVVGVQHVADEVALLQDAARRIAWDGEGWADVINEWHSRTPPIFGSTGKPWSVQALQRTLTGPRAAGKTEYTVEDDDGNQSVDLATAVWRPIIDEKTWTRLRSLLKPTGNRGGRRAYLLSEGLLLCGRCLMPLSGTKRAVPRGADAVMTEVLTYRCKSGPQDRAKGSCGKLSVLAEPVESLIVARVLRRLSESTELLQGLAERGTDIDTLLAAQLRIIAECDAKLEDLARMHAQPEDLGGMGDAEWRVHRTEILPIKAEAARNAKRIAETLSAPVPVGDARDDLVAWFEALTMTQQRALLRVHVSSAKVLPTGRSGPRFDPRRVVVQLADAKKIRGRG